MGTRGRKSAADLAIVPASGVISIRRPNPPPELSDEQAVEWRAVVDGAPADRYGRDFQPVLISYCRHAVSQRRIGQLIAAAEASDTLDIVEYDRLHKMQERETRALAMLAVRLGIALTTTHERKKANAFRKPWDFQGGAQHSVD